MRTPLLLILSLALPATAPAKNLKKDYHAWLCSGAGEVFGPPLPNGGRLVFDSRIPALTQLLFRYDAEQWGVPLDKGTPIYVSVCKDTVIHGEYVVGMAYTGQVKGLILSDILTIDEARVTFLHEIGHVLGMRHRDDPYSIMRPWLMPNSKPVVSKADIEELNAVRKGTQ